MPSLEALMPTMENDLADALTRLSSLSPAARAAVLLAPLQQAAAAASTPAQAHAAFVRVVRDVYAPAIREAHRRYGKSVQELLNDLATALGAGGVHLAELSKLSYRAQPNTPIPLQDFMVGLLVELGSLRDVPFTLVVDTPGRSF